jgi:predicted HD superfamily hydrolase involved in NAD metabolism
MPYEQYLPFLEKVLTPRRLAHSLGVMGVMGELADVYGFDREKALVTGVLHDAGKDLTAAQQAEILSQAGIEIRYECESDYVHYLHGPVGAYFVRRELGLTDPLILDAIRMHTYYGNGAAFDLPICWCLRFSDLLEPTRDWSGVRWLRNGIARLRDAAYGGRMPEAAFLQTGWLIQWFGQEGVPIHPNMIRVYRDLSSGLNLDDSFLGEGL